MPQTDDRFTKGSCVARDAVTWQDEEDGGTMRVLVVEDDSDLARQLCECLVDAGYVTDVAPDGEEGHYLGANEPYDAVVLDLGLPVIDGITVLERWRQDGRLPSGSILTS
jgi:two-component system OmpR family response regulator